MLKKITKCFKSNAIISSITIGIIGTALWEKLISPLSSFIFSKVLKISNSITKNFSNDIYKDIAKGFHEDSSVLLVVIVLSGFLAITIITFEHFLGKNKNALKTEDAIYDDLPNVSINTSTSKNFFENKTFTFIINIFFLLFFFTSFLYYLGRVSFINLSITKTINNIEILSPYISDYDSKMLKSNFHLIKNKSDYDSLNSKIEELLSIYSIQLE